MYWDPTGHSAEATFGGQKLGANAAADNMAQREMRKVLNKWNPIASSVGDAARRSAGSSNNGYSYSKKFETLSVTGRVTIADGVKESADLVNRYLMDMTQIRSTRQNEILCLVEHDPWLYDYFAYSFAYVNTDYYGYTNARQAAISNILASDKSRLSFYNIESDALGIQLRNFNQEYFDAAYENAKPSVKGLVDFIRHDDNFIIKRTLGKYVRAFDVAAEMGTGLYHATKNTGYSLGDYALSLKHTGQAFSDAFQGESSWGEFYETFKADERIRESIETGYWSGWMDTAVGIGTGGAGSLEYIYNDTTYIRQGVGYVTSKKDDLLVGALDLDQDTYMRAKSIASVEMTVVSLLIGLNSAKAKGSPGATSGETTNTTKGWKVGEPVDNLTKAENQPAWSTVRQRYWKNEAYYNSQKYSAENITRMQKGLAPQRYNELVGTMESIELHHVIPQRSNLPGINNYDNLKPVWPDEHQLIDPYRKTGS